MWKLRLPTGVAIETPGKIHVTPSEGYAAYLRLWIDLFEGRQPIVSADNWAQFMDFVVERMGSTEVAIDVISQQVTLLWGIRPELVSAALGNHIQRGFVRNELEHRTAPSRIAQKLVLLTACDSMGISPSEKTTPDQMSLLLSSTRHAARLQPKEQILRTVLLQTGYPLMLVPALAAGQNLSSIAKNTGVSRNQVRRAIGGIPHATLFELNALDSWADESWLTKELQKRSCGEATTRS